MQVINNYGDPQVVVQWSTASPATSHHEAVVYLFDDKNKIFYESKELSRLSGTHQLVRENDT